MAGLLILIILILLFGASNVIDGAGCLILILVGGIFLFIFGFMGKELIEALLTGDYKDFFQIIGGFIVVLFIIGWLHLASK